MTTSNAQAPTKKRSWIWWAVGGCALLAVLACGVAAAAGGFFYLQRNRTGADQPTVEYILDSSPRMALSNEESSRLEVARGVMAEIIRPANPDLTSGLRVFGNGALPQPCQDTELIVPFAQANQDQIADELGGVSVGANSDSALSEAMIAAIKDFAATGGPHSLVVVTGGPDACNPQAGELIAQEADRAGFDLKTYVVGFQVSADDAEALRTQVGAIPGSSYQTAEDETSLRAALAAIQAQVDATAGASPRVNRGPTRQASASSTLEATASSVQQPTGASTLEATASATQQASVGQTACDHPYLPLRPGTTWSYGGETPFTWRVVAVSGGQQSATASVAFDTYNGTSTIEWPCSPSGILGSWMVGLMAATGDRPIESSSGVTLPSIAQLTSGGSWVSSYTVAQGTDFSGATGNHQVSENHQAGVPQSLTTGLGTFDVVPVTSSGTIIGTGGLDYLSLSFNNVVWYAKGVGIVRIENTLEGERVIIDLLSYTIP
jgi:hypothetical protein